MKSNKTLLYRFGIFIVVIFAVAIGLWAWWRDSVSPVNSADKTPVVFSVNKGDGVRMIAGKLSQQNLIRSPIAFFIMVKLSGIERQLQAGDYRLSRNMDASRISKELTHGTSDIWVTTLEGWRTEEIAGKLSKEMDIPESEFMKYAHEGYMFPDTYMIPRDATAAAVAQVFTDNFRRKISDSLLAQGVTNKLSPGEVVVLASIVEREGHTDEDRPVIAGILLNRLKQDMPLQVDATLQYALGYDSSDKTWWRKSLSEADKKYESAYNTYINVGLPPAPIANPGLSAIKAVVSPAKTSYLYYLHDSKGVAHYAETLDKHNTNIAKYLSY
jgi:UPF0755 protein